MKRTIVMVAACVALLSVGTAHAMTDEQRCLSERAKAKGKYEQCVAKWLAKTYGGYVDLGKIAKCRIKYAGVWPKLQRLTESSTCGGAERFVDNGATIADNLTGLSWEKKTTVVGSGANAADPDDVDNIQSWTASDGDDTDDDGTTYTAFLSALNTGGGFDSANGWRLPTFAELGTILLPEPFPCETNPCIDAIFGPTQADTYWSSTTHSGNLGSAWDVDFGDGYVDNDDKSGSEYVRAVRGGL